MTASDKNALDKKALDKQVPDKNALDKNALDKKAPDETPPDETAPNETGPNLARNVRLVVAYNGAAYSGWQVQPKVPTVQGKIEAALKQMTGSPCRLRVAGRTDAGVHAQGQLANFRTASRLSAQVFLRGLNALLPKDIAIREAEEVDTDFDSRRHNRGKHYRYQIWNLRQPAPHWAQVAWHLRGRLDLSAMVQAARHLVGSHDFRAMRAANCECKTTLRTLYRCTVSVAENQLQIDVEGTAFLKNMVRIIVGTLVDVGRGRLSADAIGALLEAGDRNQAGATAPAHGLTLMRVFL